MLRVLGTVEVDGHGVLGSQAQRVITAALVLDAGTTVSADRLAELVWGEDQPEHPTSSLQNHLSRLRKVLPSGVAIESEGTGYRLVAGEGALDVPVFDAAFERACSLRAPDGLAAVDEALELWRGEPYGELDDPRASAERARLEETHRALHELRAEGLLAGGRTHEAVAALETLRRQDPLRERTVELLMRAHVDSGRKTDALEVYGELRAALVEQLGLDPSPELRELEQAILTEEVVAARPEPATTPEEPDPVLVPVSSFFGRQADLQRVTELLAEHRIVTLVGPGGVGKTRLSLHAAAEVSRSVTPDVAMVELAPLRDGAALGDVVVSALGLAPRSGISARERVVDTVGGRPHLLVLDNCEHVIDEAAAFVDAVVQGAPGLTVLTTSREALHIDGEHVVRVEPLDVDDAVDLFSARAASARADFALDETSRPLVEQICRALDGVPLAIELAAAREASMGLDQIIDGLGERFELLSRGRRTADDRHRSLRGLVEWSARGLDAELEAVFARLSVFADSFSPAAAAAVLAMSTTAVGVALADLADRSLLVEDRDQAGTVRYRFLETVRAYAAEMLADRADAEAIVERHSSWVLGLAGRAVSEMSDTAELDVMHALPELRVAHQRFVAAGDADRCLRLATGLHVIALVRMHSEMFGWIIETADRFGDVDHPAAEMVLGSASIGSWQSGDLDGARHYAEWAVRVGAESSWPGAGRASAAAMADVVQFAGDDAGAVELFEQALELGRGTTPAALEAIDHVDLAMVAGYVGDETRARAAVAEARRLAEPFDSASLHAWIDYAEGEALAEIDPDHAVQVLGDALRRANSVSSEFVIGVAGLTRTGLQIRSGRPADAIDGVRELVEHWRRGGAWIQQAITMRTVVDLFVRLGLFDDAGRVLGAVLASDTASEIAGADAVRLDDAKVAIVQAGHDLPTLLADGAALPAEAVVDLVLERLRTAADGS